MSTRFEYVTDADLNDSSKVFTVPSGQIWVITHVNVQMTNTATAGARRLRVIVRDESDNIYMQIESPITFPANQTQNADFFTGAQDSAAEVNDTVKVAMPLLILLPGHDLVVEDGTATDAAADDMIVSFIRTRKTV